MRISIFKSISRQKHQGNYSREIYSAAKITIAKGKTRKNITGKKKQVTGHTRKSYTSISIFLKKIKTFFIFPPLLFKFNEQA